MSNKDEGASASTPSARSLETAQPTVPSLRPQPEPETKETASETSAVSGASGEEDRGQDGKKKKNRCGVCKKKLGLTGFTCRCSGLFCSIHRYSDKHECKFDYKVIIESY